MGRLFTCSILIAYTHNFELLFALSGLIAGLLYFLFPEFKLIAPIVGCLYRLWSDSNYFCPNANKNS